MKLAEVDESWLEVARDPLLEAREPGLLLEERESMLVERLKGTSQKTMTLLFSDFSQKHCNVTTSLSPQRVALLAQATRISPQSNPEPQSTQHKRWVTAQ